MEEATGKSVADHFDLIAGTSTGGIVAIGLGLGMSASNIVSFYRDYGPQIFDQPRLNNGKLLVRLRFLLDGWKRAGRQFIWPKYDPKGLRDALTRAFGTSILGDSKVRLVIPAYQADRDDLHVFKTRHHSRLELDWRESAVDVALATSAAPTYFQAHSMPNGAPLIDGGVWANNPAGLAAVEARSILGWRDDDLFVLSLGCTEAALDIPLKAGYRQLFLKTTDLFMRSQSRASSGTAKMLSGHTGAAPRYFRYQPIVASGKFSLDSVEMIDSLCGLGASCARDALPMLRETFLDTRAEQFVPVP